MIYEDFIKTLTYDKNKILDIKNLFDNDEWYFRFIAENSDSWDLCYYWSEISYGWRIIQNYLPFYNNSQNRICPICGSLYNKMFNYHITKCGLTREKYVCMLFNLDEIPKCKNPNCNNKVSISGRKYYFRDFCSRSCKNKYNIFNHTHNFLSENRKLNEDGKDILALKSYETALCNGTHNLVCKHLLNKSNMWGWHSYPEDLLGDILFLLNIDYIREYNIIKKENGRYKYRIDYYLPDFNTGLECDGMFKWNENGNLLDYYLLRKHEIESKTGIKVIDIPSNSIYYYKHNKRDLYKLINNNDYPLVRYNYLNKINLN